MENSVTTIEGAKDEWSDRRSERFDAHIAPLTIFVDWIRAEQGRIKESSLF